MAKREENQEKIVVATIECIEKYGIKDTTIRNISEIAGVNISAVSYYFQGMDNLINIVFEQTLNNAFDISDIEINEDDDYKTVLKNIFDHWLMGAFGYPNITRAHMDSLISQTPQGVIMAEKLNAFLSTLYKVLVEHNMKDNSEQFRKLKMSYSAFMGYILLNNFSADKTRDDEFLDMIISNI